MCPAASCSPPKQHLAGGRVDWRMDWRTRQPCLIFHPTQHGSLHTHPHQHTTTHRTAPRTPTPHGAAGGCTQSILSFHPSPVPASAPWPAAGAVHTSLSCCGSGSRPAHVLPRPPAAVDRLNACMSESLLAQSHVPPSTPQHSTTPHSTAQYFPPPTPLLCPLRSAGQTLLLALLAVHYALSPTHTRSLLACTSHNCFVRGHPCAGCKPCRQAGAAEWPLARLVAYSSFFFRTCCCHPRLDRELLFHAFFPPPSLPPSYPLKTFYLLRMD